MARPLHREDTVPLPPLGDMVQRPRRAVTAPLRRRAATERLLQQAATGRLLQQAATGLPKQGEIVNLRFNRSSIICSFVSYHPRGRSFSVRSLTGISI